MLLSGRLKANQTGRARMSGSFDQTPEPRDEQADNPKADAESRKISFFNSNQFDGHSSSGPYCSAARDGVDLRVDIEHSGAADPFRGHIKW